MPIIKINGINTYYEIAGTGEPLLLIHGLGSSTLDWESQVEYFSKRYMVITFDLRGHGKTDKPPGPYTIPLFASDAFALIRELNVAPLHAAGLSLGGLILFQMAVTQPELFRSIVFINCLPDATAKDIRLRLMVFQRRMLIKLLPFSLLGKIGSKMLFPKPEHENLRKLFVERFMQNDKKAYYNSFMAIRDWDVTDRLGNIKCPVLVVSSDQDNTPIAMKEAYVTRIPEAKLVVIPDSRHAVTMERPTEFNKAMDDFLSNLKK